MQMVDAVLWALHRLPVNQQLRLNGVIAKLLDDADWAGTDHTLVEASDFQISMALWLFKLGPRGLAKSWAVDKSTLDIVMDEEKA